MLDFEPGIRSVSARTYNSYTIIVDMSLVMQRLFNLSVFLAWPAG